MESNGRHRRALGVQIGLILIGALMLIGWPREDGDVLLVPLAASLPSTINLALAHHGRIVAAAPRVGGVIVRSPNGGDDAATLIAAQVRHGTLAIGVPAAMCGALASLPGASG
ncbi:hypothetical protein GCM10011380_33540 [Sphingomonas metalli]|uniref:Uncharacterized protein n=1 Tax=Sphingomonas metalli TaxID=1779358 RepID=A0A916WY26_9SPHN|nr:hypothetical protein GCM10011380_33540 [Sphingomonas metalli]